MGRTSFVAWLFIMAVVCLLLALTDASWGWFGGGLVLFAVALFARRQFKKERETGYQGASGSFAVVAILVMVVAMLFLFWLPSFA